MLGGMDPEKVAVDEEIATVWSPVLRFVAVIPTERYKESTAAGQSPVISSNMAFEPSAQPTPTEQPEAISVVPMEFEIALVLLLTMFSGPQSVPLNRL